MAKKKKSLKKEEKRRVHRVTFHKNPIWLSMNIIGLYEGIKYRFTYRKYYNKEAEAVVTTFLFMWPGRIPEDKAYAEKGIKALFLKSLEDGTFNHDVIEVDETLSNEREEEALLKELDATIQEGLEE